MTILLLSISTEVQRTARRPQFHNGITAPAHLRPVNLTHAVRVRIIDENAVCLLSSTYLPPPPITPSSLLELEVLHSWAWGNNSLWLWDDLQLDGDGSGLVEGIMQGTVEGAADGSFMKDISTDVCSAAFTFMLMCNSSKRKLVGTGTWVE